MQVASVCVAPKFHHMQTGCVDVTENLVDRLWEHKKVSRVQIDPELLMNPHESRFAERSDLVGVARSSGDQNINRRGIRVPSRRRTMLLRIGALHKGDGREVVDYFELNE